MPAKSISLLPLDASAVVLSATLPYRRGADAALPARVKILDCGENIGRTTGMLIRVGEVTQACLSANQTRTASERVPLDYEHQSVPGHPNFLPDPRNVAGHGTIEIVPDDGVYLSAIDYTPNGSQFAGNYQDVSAVAYLDAEKNLLFVRSVALTQHGDVAGMEFAEAVAASASLSLPGGHPRTTTRNPQSTMSTNASPPAYRDKLIALLQLAPADGADGVTDDQINTALDTFVKQEETEPGEPVKPNTVAALSARMDTIDRKNLIAEAGRAGKVIPLTDAVLATLPMVALSALIDGLPAGQVATAPGGNIAELPAARMVALSAEQSAAAKALGLSEEDYRKALS